VLCINCKGSVAAWRLPCQQLLCSISTEFSTLLMVLPGAVLVFAAGKAFLPGSPAFAMLLIWICSVVAAEIAHWVRQLARPCCTDWRTPAPTPPVVTALAVAHITATRFHVVACYLASHRLGALGVQQFLTCSALAQSWHSVVTSAFTRSVANIKIPPTSQILSDEQS
jgi:hypothetical protein